VVRLIRPDGGSIRFGGEDITRMRGQRLRRIRPKMQMVFQDPASALDPRLTAWDAIAEPLRYHNVVTGAAVDERVAGLLEMVELDPRHARRRPHEYSGGQQQRIAIARSLALSPAMLVLDEPLSALDVSVQAGVINMLNRVRRELSLSYLVISHDLSVVQHLCEDVSVMYLGKVIETGPTAAVFAHPRHPYSRALLSAVPDPGRRGEQGRIVLEGEVPSPTNPPSGCRFRTRCWKAESICAQEMPPLTPDPAAEGRSVACHFPE
jgi:oligopeptide/dipeptide ABC transporter ATP-binding protein